MKKVFAFLSLIFLNTCVQAKHNNLSFTTLNPIKWEYQFAIPTFYHVKLEDYFKDTNKSNNKDNYEKQTKHS